MANIIDLLHISITKDQHDITEWLIGQLCTENSDYEIILDNKIMEYLRHLQNTVIMTKIVKHLVVLKNHAKILQDIFATHCGNGNHHQVVNMQKMLKSNDQQMFDVHHQGETPFLTACFSNQLVTAQEMLRCQKKMHDSNPTLHKMIDINISDNLAFRKACQRDSIDVAKWLYQESSHNIPISDEILENMFDITDNNVKKWLISLFPVITLKMNSYEMRKITQCVEYYNKIHKTNIKLD
jgi:hypothetical protein